jgi:hypothetical protein
MEDKNLKNELAISNSQLKSHNLGKQKKRESEINVSKFFNFEDYRADFGFSNAYLDRLTIVGNLPDEFQGDLSVFGAIPIDILARYPNGGYRGQLYSDRKQRLYFDYDPEKAKKMRIRNFRIECNPNLLSKDQLVMLFTKVVPVLAKVGISRLDLAFDYQRNLSDFAFSKSVSGGKFWDKSGNTQTIYFGAPSSDYRIRLYDKKAERLAKGSEEDKRDYSSYDVLWRLEYELTGSGFIERQLRKDFEILKQAEISKRDYDLKRPVSLSPLEKIMLKAFDEDKDMFNELSKNTKTRYKKLAQDISTVSLTNNLMNIIHQLQICSDYPFYIDLIDFCTDILNKKFDWIFEV